MREERIFADSQLGLEASVEENIQGRGYPSPGSDRVVSDILTLTLTLGFLTVVSRLEVLHLDFGRHGDSQKRKAQRLAGDCCGCGHTWDDVAVIQIVYVCKIM